jgi:hypothetical protein
MDGAKARTWQGRLYSADEGTDVGRFLSGEGGHEQDVVGGDAGIRRIETMASSLRAQACGQHPE